MAQPVMSRSQRRIEKKQTLLVLVLILVVAGVSFALGVMVGKKGGALPGMADSPVQEVRLPAATQVVPVPPAPEPEPVNETPKLTFYDNLPKGDQAPLGSGINLPPEESGSVTTGKATAEKAVVKRPTPKAKAQEAPPATSPKGAFVVQVASFRTVEDAQKLQAKLAKHGLASFHERVNLGQKGVWYRVLTGPYAERPAADQVVAMLKAEERLSALVRKR
jgi:DedD protein